MFELSQVGSRLKSPLVLNFLVNSPLVLNDLVRAVFNIITDLIEMSFIGYGMEM